MRHSTEPPDPNAGYLVPRPQGQPMAPAGWEQVPPYGRGYGYEPVEEEGSSSLLEYWKILKRHKGTLILITFLGGVLAVLVTLPQTPVYQAKSSLEIQNLNTEFMNMRQLSPVEEGGASWTREAIDTQIQILKSDTLIERTLRKLGWIDKRRGLVTEGNRVSAWRRILRLSEKEPEDPRQSLLNAMKRNVKVRAQGQTRLVEILVDSTDAKLAADFANTMGNEYILQNLEARWDMTQRTGDWLNRQLDDMRIKLEKSHERLQEYARRVGLVITEKQGSVVEERLRQVQEELSKAQAERIARQSRFELVKGSPPETLPDALSETSLRDYQAKLTDLKREHSELATTFTAEHPKVKKVQAQIATLEEALERERAGVLLRIKNEYEEAVRREKLLEIDYANQARAVTDQSEKAIQYNILNREVESNRQLYETMLERVRSASVASALRASNVRIVDQAKVPEFPYKPRLALNTLLGLMLGGFVGVAFIVMRERADRTLQEPGDLNYYVNLPELGVIPSAKREKRTKRITTKGTEDTENAAVELVTWEKKPSMLAESFRAALTSILFSGSNGMRPRVLVVTSASPAEGKSTIVSNLAIALAEVNRRVLLVDGDLRKPRLHSIFGMEKDHGLSDLLKERAPVGECMNGSVRETKVPNLFLLPSGTESAAATNLLYSDRMGQFLETFEKQYDMVLIDAPPMLHMPDARILGRMADAVILVIRAGKTTRDTALAAKQRLAEDGTKVLGTVLNYWDPKRGGGGRYGYYYDKYRYSGYYGSNH